MRTDYMQYFVESAECESMSQAARNMQISQQGLSRAIRCLETECGVDLIDRSKREFTLTPAGNQFLEDAKDIVRHFQEAMRNMEIFAQRKKSEWSKVVSLLSTVNIVYNVWPQLHKQFVQRMPNVLFSVREHPLGETVKGVALDASGDSVGIVSMPDCYSYLFEDLPVVIEPFMEMSLMARVARNSQYANYELITVDDLRNGLLVFHEDPYLADMIARLMYGDSRPCDNVLMQTNNIDLMNHALKTYDAIGFTNSFYANYVDDPAFTFIPIESTYFTPVCLVYSKFLKEDSFLQELCKTAHKIADEYPLQHAHAV